MTKLFVDGMWIIQCDVCEKQFVDPDGGTDPNSEYQCGAHHGIVKQEDKPEFQVPEDHKLYREEEEEENEDVIVTPTKRRGTL